MIHLHNPEQIKTIHLHRKHDRWAQDMPNATPSYQAKKASYIKCLLSLWSETFNPAVDSFSNLTDEVGCLFTCTKFSSRQTFDEWKFSEHWRCHVPPTTPYSGGGLQLQVEEGWVSKAEVGVENLLENAFEERKFDNIFYSLKFSCT